MKALLPILIVGAIAFPALIRAEDPQLVQTAAAHWAFAPLKPGLPEAGGPGRPSHPIDQFISHRRRAENLEPVQRASKQTLARRVYFDLLGLPPEPEALNAFLDDASEDAWPKLVDQLLASPRYGERWGRHWMDVARYADTAGDNADYPVPEAYRYRDYIIAAFNDDMPYDQFAREQLAGDILAKTGPRERYSDQLVATGFLALSRRYATGPYELWHLTLENTIETVGLAFLGLNLRCARCHDHKYDPLTTKDYYGLYGMFESTEFPWPGGEELQSKSLARQKFAPLFPAAEVESKITEWRREIQRLREEIQAVEKQAQSKERDQRLAALKTEARNLERRGLPRDVPAAYAVQEGKGGDAFIHLRGDPAKQGPEAPRRPPGCLSGGAGLDIPAGSSGRLEFSQWMTRPGNPLFARVMVNRIWQHHFGKGLVATPNNFGLRGSPPSHPELLDYLAARFIESGWSVKAMHRLMLSSGAYQLASDEHLENSMKDPANRFYWRFDRRRLEAEAIRDAMLFASGSLDLRPPGEHPFPPAEKWTWTQHTPFKDIYASQHRAVYLMTPRFQRHPFLALFDGPDPNVSTEERRASIVPQQALYSLNNPFAHQQAQTFARRVLAFSEDEAQRVRHAHELAWSRGPSAMEAARASAFLARAREAARESDLPEPDKEAWTSLSRVLFSANEFFYVD